MDYDENLCRLCLQIDQSSNKQPLSISVLNALKDIFKIRISDAQTLPTHLCAQCSKIVTQFYTFYLEKMANQAKLLLGLDKFGLTAHHKDIPRTSEGECDSDSTISMDDSELEEQHKRLTASQSIPIEIANEPVQSYDSQITLPDLVHNPNFHLTTERPAVESFDTFPSSQGFSQESAISDENFANDPTYTPPESVERSQSSSSDDDAPVLRIPKKRPPSVRLFDSDDSDVQITGFISALNNTVKRKMSQSSIMDFFIAKKEKIEQKRINKITNYFDTNDQK